MADLQRTLALAESHLSMDIRRAVARLTARQQQAILLVYIIGMTESEAADALGIDLSNVSRALDRALQAVRKIFLVGSARKTDVVVRNRVGERD